MRRRPGAAYCAACRPEADAETFGDAGAKPFEQHVGVFGQAQHHFNAALL